MRGGGDIDFRQLLQTPVDFRDMRGRKTEDGRSGIARKSGEIGLNCSNQGGLGEILHPSDFSDFCGMCGRRVGIWIP